MPNEINTLFNETHPYKYKVNETTSLESLLTFVRSVNIQAFPCGRRTSAQESAQQDYYFPFDPEARLNTEANNRKHSSLNGYTQTYLKEWDSSEKLLTLSLAGYLFTVALDGTYTTIVDGNEVTSAFNYSAVADFCSAIITQLSEKADSILSSARSATIDTEEKIAAAEELLRNIESSDYIYANILLEDVHLFSGTPKEYFTSILRDQYDTTNSELAAADIGPNPLLDILNKAAEDAANFEPKLNPDNYFFSGLSFSATPLTGVEATRSSALHHVDREHMPNDTTTQLVVSLRILEKVKTSAEGVVPETFAWQIHQPAYLPKIEHGVTEDSIVVTGDALLKSDLAVNGDVEVDGNINATSITVPYSGEQDGDTTEVNSTGIYAPYVEAKYIKAEGIAVGNEIAITDENDTPITIVGTNITTDGNITAKGNITAEDNLNIGNPDAPAQNDNGGCIVAENDITAEHDLIAKNNLKVDVNAEVTGNLTVNGTITADTALANGANNLIVNKADIETADIYTLTGNTATITTVNSDDINQKVGNDYYDVPVLFLDRDGSEYKLRISRVNKTF